MNVIEVKTYDFKTNFSSYLADLKAGKFEKIIVMNRNEPVGEFMLPQPQENKGFKPGLWKGRFEFDKELFDSADAEIIEDFENSKIFPDGDY